MMKIFILLNVSVIAFVTTLISGNPQASQCHYLAHVLLLNFGQDLKIPEGYSGQWCSWRLCNDGVKRKTSHVVSGKKNGSEQEFGDCGCLKRSSLYREGSLHGVQIEYVDSCADEIEAVDKDLRIRRVGIYRMGKKKYRAHFIDGSLDSIHHLLDGRKITIIYSRTYRIDCRNEYVLPELLKGHSTFRQN